MSSNLAIFNGRRMIPQRDRIREAVIHSLPSQPTASSHSFRYYDNTRISDYRTCPRYFYLRHVRYWRPQGKSLALINGSAWHEAMDAVWRYAHSDLSNGELLQLAHDAYVKKWMEEGMPHPDEIDLSTQEAMSPRGPFIARSILFEYIQARRQFIRDVEILDIERPFAVPIVYNSDNSVAVFFIGRLDKAVKHPSHGKLIIEHKTTSWYATQGNFRREFLDGFSPNSQIDGYIYSGNLLYENINGVWVDAALFHKKVHDGFKFLPIDRQFEMIDQWKDDTLYWIGRIESDLEALGANGLRGTFPKNTGSCGNYGGCSYRDVCRFYTDPSSLTEPPAGYVTERWDPFDVLKIEKLGLEPEVKDETPSENNVDSVPEQSVSGS